MDQTLSKGDIVAGRYVVDRNVGSGASGSVWTAEDRQLRRAVALKVMHAEHVHRLGARESFEAEAQALAQIRSNNVVDVYDFGIHCDRPFIVMELLEGEGLDRRLAKYKRLSLSSVVGIVAELAEGLCRLHAQRIVHRDVKPANVFLVREGHGEVAKLLDFGVCGRYDGPTELAVVPPGTPRYMSPEHFSGQSLGSSVDCWSLAVVAYEMLCGVCPFDGHTLENLRRNICAGSITPPSSHAPGLAASVDVLFAKAFAPHHSRRLTDPAEFAAELRRLLNEYGEPIARILFVDDEEDFKFLIRARFRREIESGTHELFFARSGESGLDLLRTNPGIHVVFTDLNMPGMNGLTFLARVPEVNPLVRVVVLSAYGDMTNIRAAMNHGAFDFLCKPIDLEDLKLTAKRCVADVTELRRSLASREENGILRLLLGQNVVDHFINATRTGTFTAEQSHCAVLALSFGLATPTVPDGSTEQCLRWLAVRLDSVQSEVSAQHGFIAELAATTALVVFRGDGALNRAVDAALALREQLREGFSDSAREAWQPRDFRAGIDAGTIAVGSTLVPGLGRVEHLLFGPAVARARSLRDAAIAEEILVAKGSESLLSEYRQGVRDELSVVGAVSVQFKGRSSASHSSCTEDGSGDVTCPIRLANDGPSG